MSHERAAEDVGASPLALHLALWIPFAFLIVLSWFTVMAPELATEPPGALERSHEEPEPGEATPPDDRPTR